MLTVANWFVGLAFLCFNCGDVVEFKVESDLEIKTTANGSMFRSSVEVEGIENQKKYRIHIAANNPSELDFEFDRVVTSCNCSTFIKAKNFFSPGENLSYVDFDAPASNRSGNFAVTIDFYQQKQHVGHLRLFGKFHGAVHIERRMHTFEIDEDDVPKVLSVPFSFTDPIDPTQLSIYQSDAIKDIGSTIVQKDDVWLIAFDPTTIDLSKGDLTGSIGLQYAGEKVANAPITFAKQLPIEIRPSTAFFRESKDQFQCKFMVSISPSMAASPDTGAAVSNCQCVVNGVPMKVSVIPLTKKIYKVFVLSLIHI